MAVREIDWVGAERPFECPWFAVERVGSWHRILQAAGAVAVPFLDQPGEAGSRVLMVGTHRPALGTALLEFPRGGALPGETAVETAVREALEETGHAQVGAAAQLVGMLAPDGGLLAASAPVVMFEVEATPSGEMDGEAVHTELVRWEDVPSVVARSGGCGITLAAWAMTEAWFHERADALADCILSDQVPAHRAAELMRSARVAGSIERRRR